MRIIVINRVFFSVVCSLFRQTLISVCLLPNLSVSFWAFTLQISSLASSTPLHYWALSRYDLIDVVHCCINSEPQLDGGLFRCWRSVYWRREAAADQEAEEELEEIGHRSATCQRARDRTACWTELVWRGKHSCHVDQWLHRVRRQLEMLYMLIG